MNITRINKLIQSNTDHERAFRNILVKCYCDQDLKESLKNKLEEYHAQDINVRELTDSELSETDNYNCEVTYSVWDEKGSLLESLTPFQVYRHDIMFIFYYSHKIECPHNNNY